MRYFDQSESQLKQYINAEQLLLAYRNALKRATQYRGGMLWRVQNGREYLIKTAPNGSQRSLGPRDPATEAVMREFLAAKQATEASLAVLKQRVEEARRLNRALRIGHCPNVVVDILNAVAKARLEDHFMVIGTNALYAYEAHSGVRFQEDITSTEDMGLLWDSRKSISLAVTEDIKQTGLLGILRKADPSFEMIEDEPYRAANKTGYLVDLIKRRPASLYDEKEQQQLYPNPGDFWAAKIRNMDWLLSSPRFRQVVVSTNGNMAYMVAPDPRAFVLFKAWLSKKPDRNPLKKPRDWKQAEAVYELVNDRLPHLSFEEIKVFPENLRDPFDTDEKADQPGPPGDAR